MAETKETKVEERIEGKEEKRSSSDLLRILHISDTHNMHRSIETTFGPMPDADILLHTGDFTNDGTEAEYADFHDWLTSLKPRYKHILVIPGNHDFREDCKLASTGKLDPKKVLDPKRVQKKLPGVKVLHHETVNIDGLTIYGSPWEPWHLSVNPQNGSCHQADRNVIFHAKEDPNVHHRYHDIPLNTHVYLTHGPPKRLLDCIGAQSSWGSSSMMRYCIEKMKPQVHCFGHLHEQRGYYWKDPATGKFHGGVEYERRPGEGSFETIECPPKDYPCQVVSNNAMCNHHRLEEISTPFIKGKPRLLLAQKTREAYDPKLEPTVPQWPSKVQKMAEKFGGAAATADGSGESQTKTEQKVVEPTPRSQWVCDWNFTVAPATSNE